MKHFTSQTYIKSKFVYYQFPTNLCIFFLKENVLNVSVVFDDTMMQSTLRCTFLIISPNSLSNFLIIFEKNFKNLSNFSWHFLVSYSSKLKKVIVILVLLSKTQQGQRLSDLILSQREKHRKLFFRYNRSVFQHIPSFQLTSIRFFKMCQNHRPHFFHSRFRNRRYSIGVRSGCKVDDSNSRHIFK
jgi:hypothetical protein